MNKLIYIAIVLCSFSLKAQIDLTTPELSQFSSVTQRIGLTDITITYHSPLINNRKILGGIVPYDALWRAGANENTTIRFTNAVRIEGKPLAAGIYACT